MRGGSKFGCKHVDINAIKDLKDATELSCTTTKFPEEPTANQQPGMIRTQQLSNYFYTYLEAVVARNILNFLSFDKSVKLM